MAESHLITLFLDNYYINNVTAMTEATEAYSRYIENVGEYTQQKHLVNWGMTSDFYILTISVFNQIKYKIFLPPTDFL